MFRCPNCGAAYHAKVNAQNCDCIPRNESTAVHATEKDAEARGIWSPGLLQDRRIPACEAPEVTARIAELRACRFPDLFSLIDPDGNWITLPDGRYGGDLVGTALNCPGPRLNPYNLHLHHCYWGSNHQCVKEGKCRGWPQ